MKRLKKVIAALSIIILIFTGCNITNNSPETKKTLSESENQIGTNNTETENEEVTKELTKPVEEETELINDAAKKDDNQDELPVQEPRVFADNVEPLEDGSGYAYIESVSFDLIITDNDMNIIKRVDVPLRMLESIIKDEQNSSYDWEPIIGGVAFLWEGESTTYQVSHSSIYLFDEEKFVDVELPMKGFLDLGDQYVLFSNEYEYRLDISDMSFNIWFRQSEDYRQSYVYDDVFYYYDLSDYSDAAVEIDEAMKESDKYKPFSESPEILTESGLEHIFDTSGRGEFQCVRLEESGRIGWVTDNKFLMISDVKVRTYDSNEFGIVYSGYEEEALGFYYNPSNDKTYTLDIDPAVNEIKILDNKIFVLTQGHILSRFDVDSIAKDETWTADKVIDLMELPGYESLPNFFMDANESQLVVYTDNYAIEQSQVFMTYVLNPDFEVLQVVEGLYNGITEGYVFARMYPYLVRCDIKTGVHEIIDEGVFTGFSQYFDGDLILMFAYEGPPIFNIYDNVSDLIDVQVNEEDVLIYYYGLHQTHFVMVDHIDKKVRYITYAWFFDKIWIDREELHIIRDGLESIYDLDADKEYLIVNGGKR